MPARRVEKRMVFFCRDRGCKRSRIEKIEKGRSYKKDVV
jgi:hypothetical protein